MKKCDKWGHKIMRVEIKRTDNMPTEIVDVDFKSMIVRINKVSFIIHRMKESGNAWYFRPTNGTTGLRALTDGASESIERAYINWTLEQTILGGSDNATG